MQTIEQWIEKLEEFDPCYDAIEWAQIQPDPQTLWNNCERGDWMLWLVGKLSGGTRSKSRKKLVLAACECARLALPYVKKDEKRPLQAIETTEAWVNGKAKLREVRQAAAYAAAAYAAAAAAYTDAAAADAAAAAADAAAAAAYAAAAYATVRKDFLRKCADITRKYYPKVPKLSGNSPGGKGWNLVIPNMLVEKHTSGFWK